MYAEHFGLSELPFSLTPDPRYVYMSERHREALAHLIYGISQGDGFVQLTGEVGTGKTTICRCLLEQLPSDVDVALIFNPRLNSYELLAAVCDELRVSYPAGTPSVKTLVDTLYRHLLAAHERGRRTVLIIDEAQNLSVEVLEQVRLLTNLETTRDKLLQIILIGQTELGALLEKPELRQLAQRVTARYHLRPFAHDETRAYVIHRLAVAGRTRMLFSPWALREVHRLSRGVPRLINVICDRALLGAYATGRSWVDVRTVRRAAREVRGARISGHRLPWVAALAAAAGLAAMLVTSDRLLNFFSLPEPPKDVSSVAVVASTDVPQASPPGNGNGAVAEPRQLPALDIPLEEVLVSPSMQTDRQKAFAALFSRWGVRYASNSDACDFGRSSGLRCLARSGTWGWLRRLDLPAVIELRTRAGERYYAAVVALDEQRATLDFGGGNELPFPLAEIDRHWNGSFVLLWSAPLSNSVLVPGQKGSDVQWLRRRLASLDGASAAADKDKGGDVYDGDVIKRVKEFQRSRLLSPDGVAGEETLAHLSAAVPEPGKPRLSAGTK
jgi:general secretion pathway protein A